MARIRRMGEVYSAGDVTVTLPGMFDVNPSSIEYDYKYAHEYQRGLRRDPRGWRMGAKEMNSKITLPLDVIAELEKRFKRLELIRPFPIIVEFINTTNDTVRDIIIAKFQGNGRKVSGDSELEYEYELFPVSMELNVV